MHPGTGMNSKRIQSVTPNQSLSTHIWFYIKVPTSWMLSTRILLFRKGTHPLFDIQHTGQTSLEIMTEPLVNKRSLKYADHPLCKELPKWFFCKPKWWDQCKTFNSSAAIRCFLMKLIRIICYGWLLLNRIVLSCYPE